MLNGSFSGYVTMGKFLFSFFRFSQDHYATAVGMFVFEWFVSRSLRYSDSGILKKRSESSYEDNVNRIQRNSNIKI